MPKRVILPDYYVYVIGRYVYAYSTNHSMRHYTFIRMQMTQNKWSHVLEYWSRGVAICFEYRPPVIVDPNVRLLKSDPPDISRPGTQAMGPLAVDGGEAHRLSYNLCSHLKETLPGGTWSRIARTPRVWSYITSRPYLESFVTDSIGVAFGASSSWEERLTFKKYCHLKVEFSFDSVVVVKNTRPIVTRSLFRSRSQRGRVIEFWIILHFLLTL